MPLEPHPVSGEVELSDNVPIWFRRADEETLFARLRVSELRLAVTYLWCEAGGPDAEDAEPGWKVSELSAIDDCGEEKEEGWCRSLEEAEAGFAARTGRMNGSAASASTNGGGVALSNGHATNGAPSMSITAADDDVQDDDDDGSYWAAYDQTPGPTAPGSAAPGGRTPAKYSPARGVSSLGSDDGYFDRYMSEVQPAADPYDPAEAAAAAAVSPVLVDHEHAEGESSTWSSQHVVSLPSPSRVLSVPDSPRHDDEDSGSRRQRSRGGSGSGGEEQAEVGVRQHISTDIKSLYRLARATGISRPEFERIVRTELDVLGMMELDMEEEG
jgi:hypothetical protein